MQALPMDATETFARIARTEAIRSAVREAAILASIIETRQAREKAEAMAALFPGDRVFQVMLHNIDARMEGLLAS